MNNREIGFYRDFKILELGYEERYFTADDALKHAFPERLSPGHHVHQRHLRALVAKGFLLTFGSPALPPGKKLYTLTRQGAVFLSQYVPIPLEGLSLIRSGVKPTTVNHHLSILRVRHALSRFPQVSWVPNRFVQSWFSKQDLLKIPDALFCVSLPTSHQYWGDLAVVAVEVELSWKDRSRRESDLARLYAASGSHFSNLLIVGGTDSIAESLKRSLSRIVGQEVPAEEGKKVRIPEWFPKACTFWSLDRIESLTLEDLGYMPRAYMESGTYERWFDPVWRQALDDRFLRGG